MLYHKRSLHANRCNYFFAEYFLINVLAFIPDSFRSSSFHPPTAAAVFFKTEQVSSLSETDQVIQLSLFFSAHSIQRFHSASSMGPLPLASIPADSEIKTGIPFRRAYSVRSRNSCL